MIDNDRYGSGEPGPGLEVADWMVGKGVAISGCDTWSFGPVPPENAKRPFEVPQKLNVEHGLFIMENLKTEELAKASAREFMFVLTHAKTRGATAASIAPAAII
jgi:kynurenine formamidase